jgi:hypothetical protein
MDGTRLVAAWPEKVQNFKVFPDEVETGSPSGNATRKNK